LHKCEEQLTMFNNDVSVGCPRQFAATAEQKPGKGWRSDWQCTVTRSQQVTSSRCRTRCHIAANGIGREKGDGSAQRGRSVIYDCLVLFLNRTKYFPTLAYYSSESALRADIKLLNASSVENINKKRKSFTTVSVSYSNRELLRASVNKLRRLERCYSFHACLIM